jgi:hypothetical protein
MIRTECREPEARGLRRAVRPGRFGAAPEQLVRSASRRGRKDFGVNRARIESIHATFQRTP